MILDGWVDDVCECGCGRGWGLVVVCVAEGFDVLGDGKVGLLDGEVTGVQNFLSAECLAAGGGPEQLHGEREDGGKVRWSF